MSKKRKRKSKKTSALEAGLYGPRTSIPVEVEPIRVLTREEEEAREARLRQFFPLLELGGGL